MSTSILRVSVSGGFLVLALVLLTSTSFAQNPNAQRNTPGNSNSREARPVQTQQAQEDRTPQAQTGNQQTQAGENASNMVQQRREAAQQRANTARERFRQQAAEIRDEAKRTAAERINSALETINTNKTDAWANALDALSNILARIQNRADEAAEAGTDTTTINQLITAAEEAIETATADLEEQASNQYVLEISDENSLRSDIQPTVQELKQDLRSTLDSVLNAKDAVREAARTLGGLEIEDDTESATESSDLQPAN